MVIWSCLLEYLSFDMLLKWSWILTNAITGDQVFFSVFIFEFLDFFEWIASKLLASRSSSRMIVLIYLNFYCFSIKSWPESFLSYTRILALSRSIACFVYYKWFWYTRCQSSITNISWAPKVKKILTHILQTWFKPLLCTLKTTHWLKSML